jgi:general secretion pathway protein F
MPGCWACPLLGRHLRTLDATRFASTLSILAGSGVPLLAALDAGRQVISRLPLADAVGVAAERVREGQPLSKALGASRQFPPLLIHMIANGEATGRVDELLDRAARLQQAELENRTATLTALLEPVLLLADGRLRAADRDGGDAADHRNQHPDEIRKPRCSKRSAAPAASP